VIPNLIFSSRHIPLLHGNAPSLRRQLFGILAPKNAFAKLSPE